MDLTEHKLGEEIELTAKAIGQIRDYAKRLGLRHKVETKEDLNRMLERMNKMRQDARTIRGLMRNHPMGRKVIEDMKINNLDPRKVDLKVIAKKAQEIKAEKFASVLFNKRADKQLHPETLGKSLAPSAPATPNAIQQNKTVQPAAATNPGQTVGQPTPSTVQPQANPTDMFGYLSKNVTGNVTPSDIAAPAQAPANWDEYRTNQYQNPGVFNYAIGKIQQNPNNKYSPEFTQRLTQLQALHQSKDPSFGQAAGGFVKDVADNKMEGVSMGLQDPIRGASIFSDKPQTPFQSHASQEAAKSTDAMPGFSATDAISSMIPGAGIVGLASSAKGLLDQYTKNKATEAAKGIAGAADNTAMTAFDKPTLKEWLGARELPGSAVQMEDEVLYKNAMDRKDYQTLADLTTKNTARAMKEAVKGAVNETPLGSAANAISGFMGNAGDMAKNVGGMISGGVGKMLGEMSTDNIMDWLKNAIPTMTRAFQTGHYTELLPYIIGLGGLAGTVGSIFSGKGLGTLIGMLTMIGGAGAAFHNYQSGKETPAPTTPPAQATTPAEPVVQ